MVRWIALLVSLAIAPAVAAADESGESARSGTDASAAGDGSRASSERDPERLEDRDAASGTTNDTRRPRVRVTFAEPGTLLAPIVAELSGLGVDVERDETESVSSSSASSRTPSGSPSDAPSRSSALAVRDEAQLDGWVRLVAPGPTRFVVEIWLVVPTFEHVATIDANDEAPASVALRSVELLRAALVGARAFRRAPVAAPVSEPPPPPPARVEAPPTPASSPRANVGAVLGAGLGASPGGGVVPLAMLGLSLRLGAPIELAVAAGIPIAESRTHVDEGRVDVRVVPLDVSVRYAPRFGIVGLTLGAALGATVTRVVGSTTDEALLGRSRRTTGATFAGIVGSGVSLGETVELIAEARVGRFFSTLDVQVGERTVRTWAAWMQAMLGLRIRLVGGTR
ncbi:MAG: hypothetical protein MUE69_06135 [Myxococcota bacterium]|nr:hypothetical protein [Myxococcota bacterium]